MRFLKINFTKIFNSLLFTFIALVFVSQLALTLPNIRNLLSNIDKEESTYVSSETEKENYGELKLSIEGARPDPNIKILQNGEVVSTFSDETVTIKVYDNSVIEIDGTQYSNSFTINVANKSQNITGLEIENIQVNSNIAILGRIFIK